MPTYSIVDFTDTIVKVVEDSMELLFKKCYCSTDVDGDYLLFFAHELETGKLRQQYRILYSDCVAPAAASAILLQVAVDAIIENYAGGGGGGSGTVTNVSALTIGTTGTDLSSSVANPTTTPVITLNVPTASSSNRGALSSSDWTIFNGKQAALGFTPENVANKATDLTSPDNTKYPTTLAVSAALADISVNKTMALIAAY